MRKFIERAMKKLPKLDQGQIRDLLYQIASEHELLETVLDSLTIGVVLTDENHRAILVNKAADRQLPFVSNDVLEKHLWVTIADADIADFVHKALDNQDTIADFEFTIDAGGLAKILALSIVPAVNSGKIRGSILLIEDVSEKRVREARLRRAESLASLTTLAAGVAHEIKNPLGSISIHIQLLQKLLQRSCAGATENPEVFRYLDVMNEEVDRLNRIVVDFLFAVRPMDTHLSLGNLNDVVDDVLDFMEPELTQSRVNLARDLQEQLPSVLLDPKYMKQAILNIVKNAMAAMPDGGSLRVTTQHRGDEVVLRITDNGIGMSEEIVEKIFEPYFTTKEFGSGIGLTLVYKVVKEHGADISVLSQVDKGATFSIHLPIPQKEQYLIGYHDQRLEEVGDI